VNKEIGKYVYDHNFSHFPVACIAHEKCLNNAV